MRIDEIDSTHKEFKDVILDHELTEEQLAEAGFLAAIPAIAGVAGNVGRFALTRAAPAIGRGIATGAKTLARGAGALARGVSRGTGALARGIGMPGGGGSGGPNQTIGRIGQALGNAGDDLASQQQGKPDKKPQKPAQSLKTNTAAKLSQPSGTIGTQGTQSTQSTGSQQLKRGDQLSVPVTDPKSPNKTTPAQMKVKNVSGSEVEFEPAKRSKGLPKAIKFNKKDLQLQ